MGTPPKIKKTQVPIILQYYLLPLFTYNILQQKWITGSSSKQALRRGQHNKRCRAANLFHPLHHRNQIHHPRCRCRCRHHRRRQSQPRSRAHPRQESARDPRTDIRLYYCTANNAGWGNDDGCYTWLGWSGKEGRHEWNEWTGSKAGNVRMVESKSKLWV